MLLKRAVDATGFGRAVTEAQLTGFRPLFTASAAADNPSHGRERFVEMHVQSSDRQLAHDRNRLCGFWCRAWQHLSSQPPCVHPASVALDDCTGLRRRKRPPSAQSVAQAGAAYRHSINHLRPRALRRRGRVFQRPGPIHFWRNETDKENLMARDISKHIERLQSRRTGMDRYPVLNESARLEVIANLPVIACHSTRLISKSTQNAGKSVCLSLQPAGKLTSSFRVKTVTGGVVRRQHSRICDDARRVSLPR